MTRDYKYTKKTIVNELEKPLLTQKECIFTRIGSKIIPCFSQPCKEFFEKLHYNWPLQIEKSDNSAYFGRTSIDPKTGHSYLADRFSVFQLFGKQCVCFFLM